MAFNLFSFAASIAELSLITTTVIQRSITASNGIQRIVTYTNGIAYRPHFLCSWSRPVTSIGAFLKRSGNWTSEKGAIVFLHPRFQQRNHNPSLLFLVFVLFHSTRCLFVLLLLSPYNTNLLARYLVLLCLSLYLEIFARSSSSSFRTSLSAYRRIYRRGQ